MFSSKKAMNKHERSEPKRVALKEKKMGERDVVKPSAKAKKATVKAPIKKTNKK